MIELPTVLTIGNRQYDELCTESRLDSRLRKHRNLHTSLDDPCQRLLVAMQPRSYLRPHRHAAPPKDKCYVALQGLLGIVWFDAAGKHIGNQLLAPMSATQMAVISAGVWHTIIALSVDSLFLETKPGPYTPLAERDWASWAPGPDASTTPWFVDWLYSLFPAEKTV